MRLTINTLTLIALLTLPIGAAAASASCPADVDADDAVGATDLLAVVASWGPCRDCAADIDADGTVRFADLTILLSQWGPCPAIEAKCAADIPPFYDPTGSDVEWLASGVCGDALDGVDGPPVCTEGQYLQVLEDINYILETYEAADAILNPVGGGGQTYMTQPYTLLCTTGDQSGFPAETFDDVNACYNADTRWLFFDNIVIIDFNWGVNTDNVLEEYQAAVEAAVPGAICELDLLMGLGNHSLIGTGIQATFDAGWTNYQVLATEQCDFFGCRCLAEFGLWADGKGNYSEYMAENNNTSSECSDPRFYF